MAVSEAAAGGAEAAAEGAETALLQGEELVGEHLREKADVSDPPPLVRPPSPSVPLVPPPPLIPLIHLSGELSCAARPHRQRAEEERDLKGKPQRLAKEEGPSALYLEAEGQGDSIAALEGLLADQGQDPSDLDLEGLLAALEGKVMGPPLAFPARPSGAMQLAMTQQLAQVDLERQLVMGQRLTQKLALQQQFAMEQLGQQLVEQVAERQLWRARCLALEAELLVSRSAEPRILIQIQIRSDPEPAVVQDPPITSPSAEVTGGEAMLSLGQHTHQHAEPGADADRGPENAGSTGGSVAGTVVLGAASAANLGVCAPGCAGASQLKAAHGSRMNRRWVVVGEVQACSKGGTQAEGVESRSMANLVVEVLAPHILTMCRLLFLSGGDRRRTEPCRIWSRSTARAILPSLPAVIRTGWGGEARCEGNLRHEDINMSRQLSHLRRIRRLQ